jgi:hypothetical protein
MNAPTDENGNISIDDFYNLVEQMVNNIRENRAGTPPVSRDNVLLPPPPQPQGYVRPTNLRRTFRFN